MTTESDALLHEMRVLITEARQHFRTRVEAVLREARTLADDFAGAVGEVSADQAFAVWRAELVTRLTDDGEGL